MYQPRHFTEERTDVLHGLMQEHPLCTLVTLGAEGMVANAIPLMLQPHRGAHGTLVGHVARANPVWKETDLNVPVLAIFHGPQHYMSPGWYATKREHGKVVPTWNYVMVQARGRMVVHDDAAWVRALVETLTNHHEASQATPWSVADAPADYLDSMVRAVVGIEIPVDSLVGKWKVSQNQPEANRVSAAAGLASVGSAQGAAMAALVAASAKGG